MNYQIFRGTGVALITPFMPEGGVDFSALERIIDHVVEGKVDYIVSLGTTGEAITLNSRECQEVLSFTVKYVAGRVPIVAGYFGSNSTTHLLERIKSVNLEGVSALLSSSPAYSKPTQEGIFQHYMAVADASPLPIILYNVPGRTASNVAPETLIRLANESSKFVGVKEASGNMNQIQYLLKHRPSTDFLVISGDDQTTLASIACGADGVISVIANAYPKEWTSMVNAAMGGDFVVSRHLNDFLHDIHPLLYVEGNPVGIKAACSILELSPNVFRLPLTPMTVGNYNKLRVEMGKLKK
jgi:4-hydroxy-tetrahydrodipicolinate synthase